MRRCHSVLGVCVMGALAVGLHAVSARADSVGAFYQGKQISIYTGSGPGGGYDHYARLLAHYMGAHISGNPDIIVRNYPGAGGIRMANSLYNTFPEDGTAMGAFVRQTPLSSLTGNRQAKFVANKFQWIGSANRDYSLCVFWHTSSIKTTKDLFTKSPIVGGTGPGGGTYDQPMMLNNLLGTRLRMIAGFPSGTDVNLAMERGEVEGRCSWSWSSIVAIHKEWVKDKKISLVLQIAAKSHPDLKDVPLIGQFVKNEKDREVLDFLIAPLSVGRPYAVGPKVPADRVKALRTAFDVTLQDKGYLAEAKKRRMPIDSVSGNEVQALFDRLAALPHDVIKRAGEAISLTNNIQISQAKIPINTFKAKITRTKRKGKQVSWNGGGKKGKLKVGKKTKITIGGNKAKASALEKGMACDFTVKGVETALKIACK